jgi:TonB-dependent receptor-like protein/carboxypeptidase family protein
VYPQKPLVFRRFLHGGHESAHGFVTRITKVNQLGVVRIVFAATLAALTLVLPQPLRAQTASASVSGRVVDARSGAPLEKVSVSIDGVAQPVLTDADGRFAFSSLTPGKRRLSVSVVGYIFVQREVDVASGAAVTVTIPLTEGTGTYTESVTVAADTFARAQPAVASQQVLGSADIQNLRGVLADDPLRAVQVLPGVATGDDLRSEFTVRGSDFSHMNFTVEGFSTPFLLHTVRAIEDRANSGSVAMINSDILEDVALLNGSYSQRHGNRTGAEVDFRLRDGSRERKQVRIAVSGTNASVVFEGPIGGSKRGSWLVSARKSYIDLLIKRLAEEGLTFAFSDVQGKFVYDLTAKQRVELTAIAGSSELQDVDIDDPSAKFIGRNKAAIAVAGWRYTAGRGLVTARALAAYNDFRNDETTNTNLDEGDTAQAAGRIDATFGLSSALDLEAGVQVERTHETRLRHRDTNGVARVINNYTGSATRSGAFAQMRWTPVSSVTIIPGGRVDRSGLVDETLGSPWLLAEWKPHRALSIRAGGGIYRQFPDFEQVVGSLGTTANAHERATQFDLGVEGRIGTTMRWQVTVYDREEENFMRRFGSETRLVDGRVVRGNSSVRYLNRLDGYAKGVELLFQRRTPNGLSGWMSYAYGRNHYDDRLNGESFWGDLDQRHTVNLYGLYRLSERTSVTGKIRVGSNFPAPGYFTERDGGFLASDRRNEVRLPLYARVDVRANRTFNWPHARMTLFAELMNVLNRDNVRMSRPRVNTATREVRGLFEPMIPIVPSAGILIEF